MKNKILAFSIVILLTVSLLTIFPSVSAESTWWDNNWQYSKKITIDSSKVPSNLTNFPILISKTSDDFKNHARSDGYDFRFIDSTHTTEYYWELEKYDSTTGELIAWVNITHLDADVDTIIYMYYGNALADTNPSSTSTWDNNFVAVYHMDESVGNLLDSTANSNDGVFVGNLPTPATGKIGFGQDFDGSGDYIILPIACYINYAHTIEVWHEIDNPSRLANRIFNTKSDGVNTVGINVIGNYIYSGTKNGVGQWSISGGNPNTLWTQWLGSMNVDDADSYINSAITGSDTSCAIPVLDVSPIVYIGIGYAGSEVNQDFDGMMDEFRISNVKRSDSWISTTFHTTNQTSEFITFGQEELPPNNPPNKPSCVSPTDNEENVLLNTTLRVHATDIDGDSMSISFYWSDDTFIVTVNNVGNNTYAEISSLSLDYETTYSWYAVANDSLLENTSDTFSFTTISNTAPNKPISPTPINNDINTSIYTTLKIHVIDTNDDDMSVSFYWSNEILIQTLTDVSSNSYAETSSLTLSRSVGYSWYAVANDSLLENTSDTFSFTTSANTPDRPLCVYPSDNEENVSIYTTLKVHVVDITNDTMNVSFYWSDDTLIETINNVQNDTDAETSNLSLDYSTEYNWYAIANDSISETQSFTFSFTTEPEPNYPPIKPTCVLPVNNSIDVSMTTNLKVHVIDMNNDTMSVSFYWSDDTLIQTVTDVQNNTDVETSSLSLESNTGYDWYVIANDSLLETQSESFNFTTGETATPVCEHAIPSVLSDGYLYMIYRDGNINVSNLNLLMGSYSPFSVWKFNYTSQDWDSNNFTINSNDYIKVKINQSDIPYNDTLISLIPQIRFKINDSDIDDKLNITVKSNSSGNWEILKQWLNVSEGWFVCEDSNIDEYNTTYYYSIDVTDSYNNNLISDFSFVTTSTEPAIPPIIAGCKMYILTAILVLIAIGGSIYILSPKKRKR